MAEALNDPGAATEAGEIIRGSIDRIVLTPVDGALHAELHGDLATLAAFAQGQNSKNPGPAGGPGLLSVVAGTRNRLDLLLIG